MLFKLKKATLDDLSDVLSLVARYYEYDGIAFDAMKVKSAASQLIEDEKLGGIWLIYIHQKLGGYLALTFGFSLEFGGQDAFIDEFFILEEFRDQGIGKQVLEEIFSIASHHGIKAIHLEAERENKRAQTLYTKTGFQKRDQYLLMSKYLDNIAL